MPKSLTIKVSIEHRKGERAMIQIQERVRKLTDDLQALIYKAERPVASYRMHQGKERFKDIENLSTQGWEEISHGQVWGGHREYFWFDTTVEIGRASCRERV